MISDRQKKKKKRRPLKIQGGHRRFNPRLERQIDNTSTRPPIAFSIHISPCLCTCMDKFYNQSSARMSHSDIILSSIEILLYPGAQLELIIAECRARHMQLHLFQEVRNNKQTVQVNINGAFIYRQMAHQLLLCQYMLKGITAGN